MHILLRITSVETNTATDVCKFCHQYPDSTLPDKQCVLKFYEKWHETMSSADWKTH